MYKGRGMSKFSGKGVCVEVRYVCSDSWGWV